jgi:hypothetical protein
MHRPSKVGSAGALQRRNFASRLRRRPWFRIRPLWQRLDRFSGIWRRNVHRLSHGHVLRFSRRNVRRQWPDGAHRRVLKRVFFRDDRLKRARAAYRRSILRPQHHLVNRTVRASPKGLCNHVYQKTFHVLTPRITDPISAYFEPRTLDRDNQTLLLRRQFTLRRPPPFRVIAVDLQPLGRVAACCHLGNRCDCPILQANGVPATTSERHKRTNWVRVHTFKGRISRMSAIAIGIVAPGIVTTD